MKQLITLFLVSVSIYGAKAQNLQGTFESWRNYQAGFPATNLEAPYKWFGADSLVFTYGTFAGLTPQKLLFKTASAHTGNNAAMIMSRDMGGSAGVIPGLLVNAEPTIDLTNIDPNNPIASVSYMGGTPVSNRVQGITAWIKYTQKGNDQGYISVQAVLDEGSVSGADSVVGLGTYTVSQSSSTYAQVTVNITYENDTVIPDKLLVAFSSSSLSSSQGNAADSSTLYVDDVNIIGTNGISQPLFTEDIVTLYPNPANQFFYVKINSDEVYTLKLFNSVGQSVYDCKVRNNDKIYTQALVLTPGVYVFEVWNKEGTLQQRGRLSIMK